jgi:hypothetical protein
VEPSPFEKPDLMGKPTPLKNPWIHHWIWKVSDGEAEVKIVLSLYCSHLFALKYPNMTLILEIL